MVDSSHEPLLTTRQFRKPRYDVCNQRRESQRVTGRSSTRTMMIYAQRTPFLRFAFLICVLASSVEAIVPDYVEDFNAGIGSWEGNAPQFIASGGPNGDGFMQVEAIGGNGPGSRVAVYNTNGDVTGNFLDAGITGVEVDLANFPTSQVALEMRLVLFGPDGTGNRWTSNEPVTLTNDGSWQTVTFPINEENIVRTSGPADYEAMIEDVVRIMLRHDTGDPSSQGDHVIAKLGVDNFRFRTDAILVGDFDGNGNIDVDDINLLLAAVKSGANETRFDLTSDQTVDTMDILDLVEVQLNTFVGDINLDLQFDSTDLVLLFTAGEYEDAIAMNSVWQTGDWNGDGEFDTGDLLFAFQQGGYEQGPRNLVAAAVPEPNSWIGIGTCLLLGLIAQRRSYR